MDEIAEVQRHLIVAKKRVNASGYTWTLATRLGEMLTQAEQWLGPRDMSYTCLGIDFCENGPRSWYPGDCKHFVIMLHIDAMLDPDMALYQLAHECIHLISPIGGPNATVLEEGLAVVFQEDYMSRRDTSYHTKLEAYRNAAALVTDLQRFDPDIVKQLRRVEPTLSRITADMITSYDSAIPVDLAEKLSCQFSL